MSDNVKLEFLPLPAIDDELMSSYRKRMAREILRCALPKRYLLGGSPNEAQARSSLEHFRRLIGR